MVHGVDLLVRVEHLILRVLRRATGPVRYFLRARPVHLHPVNPVHPVKASDLSLAQSSGGAAASRPAGVGAKTPVVQSDDLTRERSDHPRQPKLAPLQGVVPALSGALVDRHGARRPGWRAALPDHLPPRDAPGDGARAGAVHEGPHRLLAPAGAAPRVPQAHRRQLGVAQRHAADRRSAATLCVILRQAEPVEGSRLRTVRSRSVRRSFALSG